MSMFDENKKPYRVAYNRYNKAEEAPLVIANTPVYSPSYEAISPESNTTLLTLKQFYSKYLKQKYNKYYSILKS